MNLSTKPSSVHGTQVLNEADRLMTVCNSCRYCEGLCAVFPAMEMRRAFSDGDLNYFANLCHACGACYTDCQFSPPHEFDVNVPKTLAAARAESWAAYAWPRAFSGLFVRNGLAISLIAAVSVAAFIFGFAALTDRRVLVGVHTGPGAFYALMPHNAMAALFGAAFLYAIVALAMGLRGFWRDIGEPRGTLTDPPSLWQAMKDAGQLRYLDGGGVGCVNEDERPTDHRRIYHHLTFYGFLLCFASTSVATLYHYLLAREAPYAWWDLPVVLGTLGGIGLVIGPIGLLVGKIQARSRAGRRQQHRHGFRVHANAVSGRHDRACAAAVARDFGDGPVAGASPWRGVRTVHHTALWKIRARPLSLCRAGALRARTAHDGSCLIRPDPGEDHERPHRDCRTGRRQTGRAEGNRCGCGIFHRRAYFGKSSRGARRVGLFPGRRGGLHARRAAASRRYSSTRR